MFSFTPNCLLKFLVDSGRLIDTLSDKENAKLSCSASKQHK